MKKFQFLLLDAGPVIKLFQLGIWDKFIEIADVTISGTVADEAKFASQKYEDIRIDLHVCKGLKIIEPEISITGTFYEKLPNAYKDYVELQDGEVHTLAFLCGVSSDWRLCSADGAVFRILGLLRKGEQGISLEEVLNEVGLQPGIKWDKITPRDEDWKYTRKFREQRTLMGWADFAQGQGLA